MIQSLLRNNIKKLEAYSSARDEYGGKANLYLDANENPFSNGVNRYPDPRQKNLKQLIGKIKQIETKNIVVGNGSDETIDLIIRAFCNPGKDNIIINTPTYGMYKVCADINDIECREVLLDSSFQPDIKNIFSQIDERTKIIFLCSPNNPTGNCINRSTITELLSNFKGIVVVDEAYIDFSEENTNTGLLEKYSNLVILQTLSKAWGLAGIRVGFCFAGEEITKVLNKIKYPYNVNSLSLNFAESTLKNIEEISSFKKLILKERDRLSLILSDFSFSRKVYSSDANFILWKIDNADKLYNFLKKNGIIVRKRCIAPLLRNCLRISIGTPDENNTLTEKLREYEASNIIYR